VKESFHRRKKVANKSSSTSIKSSLVKKPKKSGTSSRLKIAKPSLESNPKKFQMRLTIEKRPRRIFWTSWPSRGIEDTLFVPKFRRSWVRKKIEEKKKKKQSTISTRNWLGFPEIDFHQIGFGIIGERFFPVLSGILLR
jgi:hypothetical protein